MEHNPNPAFSKVKTWFACYSDKFCHYWTLDQYAHLDMSNILEIHHPSSQHVPRIITVLPVALPEPAAVVVCKLYDAFIHVTHMHAAAVKHRSTPGLLPPINLSNRDNNASSLQAYFMDAPAIYNGLAWGINRFTNAQVCMLYILHVAYGLDKAVSVYLFVPATGCLHCVECACMCDSPQDVP